MAVNKNFTVRNGLEVNTKLILADANTNKVGIGSTGPRFELDVAGGIGATDLYVIGISTALEYFNVGSGGKVLSVIAGAGGIGTSKVGIGTSNPEYLLEVRSPVSTGQTALYVHGDLQVTGDLSVDDIVLDQANINRLYVSQNLNLTGSGSLFVESGISTFNGYLDINSNTDISGTLNVGGATTIGGYVDINNSIDATGTVNIGGATTIGGYLDVNAASDISGTVNIGGATTIGGYLDVNAASDISGTLRVGGISTFNGYVDINSNTDISGTLNVGGITTITNTTDSTSPNNGALILDGGLGVEKSVYIGQNLNVLSNVSVTGIVTATSFSGSGRNLTGIVTGITAGSNITILESPSGNFIITSTGGGGGGGESYWAATSVGIHTLKNVGIGTTNPTSALTVTGSGLFTGIVTANTFVGSLDGNATSATTATYAITSGVSTNVVGGIGSLTQLRVSGISTLGNTVVGGATTQLVVNGNAIVTGDLTSTTLTTGNVVSSGIVTAVDFDSLSDINFKENIITINGALLKVEQLRGVKFDWKESGQPSYGVIAQELEQVLPELVHGNDPRTVNYNGIIGVLIEAIKELKSKIEEIEKKVS